MKKLIQITLVSALMVVASSTFAQGKRGMNGDRGKAKMDKMIAELELTSDQTEQVKAIFKAERAKMNEDKISREDMEKLSEEDRRIKMAQIKLERAESAKATKAKLKEVLSAEQFAKYEAMRKQEQAQRKENRQERMEHKLEKQDKHQEEPSSNG